MMRKSIDNSPEAIELSMQLNDAHNSIIELFEAIKDVFVEDELFYHAVFVRDRFLKPMNQHRYMQVLAGVNKFEAQLNVFGRYTHYFKENLSNVIALRNQFHKVRRELYRQERSRIDEKV